MSEPQWRPFDEDCPFCGGEAEGLTTGEENLVYDGDKARCSECGCPGMVRVDEDDWPHAYAYISWHDEPDCTCEWCRKQEEPDDE